MKPDHLCLDDWQIVLPAGLPPGDYRLALAVYQPWDGARLPLADGRDLLELARLTLPIES